MSAQAEGTPGGGEISTWPAPAAPPAADHVKEGSAGSDTSEPLTEDAARFLGKSVIPTVDLLRIGRML
jgi:hypothetical protein